MPGASKPRWRALLFGFEQRGHPLLPWPAFRRRLATNLLVGGGLIVASLLVGMAGYAYFAGLEATDSFLNAAMILSGMGPVDPLPTPAAKWFAGVYALFSGVAVLAISGLVFAPVIHRILHRFHVEDAASADDHPTRKQP